MKKAPEAFRTISEVSDILDTPAHVLRFWESKFYQIRPVKRAGGRRYYRPDDLALLAGIRLLLQDQGMTIRGVQKILQEQGVRHVSSLAPDPSAGASLPGRILEDHDDEPDEMTGLAADAAPVADDMSAAPDLPDAPEDSEPDGAPLPPPRVVPMRPPAVFPRSDGEEPARRVRPEGDNGPSTSDDTAEPAAEAAPERPVAATLPAQAPAPDDVAPEDSPEDAPATAPASATRLPKPDAPDLSDHALMIAADAGAERPARLLRALPPHALDAHHDQIVMLARRIDALLDRMSDASGAGRW